MRYQAALRSDRVEPVATMSLQAKRPLFEKSGAKTFVYAGPEAVSAPMPKAQQNKVFLLLFVHKK
jgi:hypothetical protein